MSQQQSMSGGGGSSSSKRHRHRHDKKSRRRHQDPSSASDTTDDTATTSSDTEMYNESAMKTTSLGDYAQEHGIDPQILQEMHEEEVFLASEAKNLKWDKVELIIDARIPMAVYVKELKATNGDIVCTLANGRLKLGEHKTSDFKSLLAVLDSHSGGGGGGGKDKESSRSSKKQRPQTHDIVKSGYLYELTMSGMGKEPTAISVNVPPIEEEGFYGKKAVITQVVMPCTMNDKKGATVKMFDRAIRNNTVEFTLRYPGVTQDQVLRSMTKLDRYNATVPFDGPIVDTFNQYNPDRAYTQANAEPNLVRMSRRRAKKYAALTIEGMKSELSCATITSGAGPTVTFSRDVPSHRTAEHQKYIATNEAQGTPYTYFASHCVSSLKHQTAITAPDVEIFGRYVVHYRNGKNGLEILDDVR